MHFRAFNPRSYFQQLTALDSRAYVRRATLTLQAKVTSSSGAAGHLIIAAISSEHHAQRRVGAAGRVPSSPLSVTLKIARHLRDIFDLRRQPENAQGDSFTVIPVWLTDLRARWRLCSAMALLPLLGLMKPIRHTLAAVLVFALPALVSCNRSAEPAPGPQYSAAPAPARDSHYTLAVHPLHNPKKLIETYQPLIDYLNLRMPGTHFELEASRDYQTYEAKFRTRAPELLLPNPWQTLEAMKVGYAVIAMAGDAEDFKGIFIVRKDSPIRNVADLKGKTVSYPSPTALAAGMMPQRFLHDHGLNINRDIHNRYVGSQESSIMNVFLKQVDAGATWPPPWRDFQKSHPESAAELKVIWQTSHLLNNSVMVRDDVPAAVRNRVQQVLLGLAADSAGRTILANMETGRFHAATDATYEPVRAFIQRFERDVRPVEIK